jgi:hypothetical protein
MGMLFHGASIAQCANYMGLKTYDTILTNNGFGYYNLTFPQFSPDSGQLVSVKVAANVTSTYGFSLSNANSIPATYDLNIGQEDQISAGYGSPYLNITPLYVGTFNLSPGQSQVNPPFPFLTNHISSDSITSAVGPFLGSGTVNVNYVSFLYTNLWAYNNAAYYFSNAVTSTTKLSMQYLYCKIGVVLATDLTHFNATLTAPLTVKLDWSAVNETAGRQYEIQRSEDGRIFATIATVNSRGELSSADYTYDDILPKDATGNFFYRLQIHDQEKFTWSLLRQVAIESPGKSLRIYPNPATDHIDIATGTPNSDWQVDIISAAGSLVQRGNFLQSNLLHLAFTTHLSAGTYFARITDLRAQRVSVSSFIVRDPN